MADDVVSIHLRFGVITALGLYQDTLVFTEAEWAKRDDKAIALAKQELSDTWVAFRSAQLADEDVLRTAEGKQAKIDELNSRITDLTITKTRIEAELAVMPAIIDTDGS